MKRKNERRLFTFGLMDYIKTVVLLTAAYFLSDFLLEHTGVENNSALIYVVTVVLISFLTDGYFFGILASVISTFFINYYFMSPYREFDFTSSGYPVALCSTLIAAILVCTITSRVKRQAEDAIERERLARELNEINARLAEEKTAMAVEAEKEKIRSNLLRAVSHDLRTPLTGILGASTVVLESGADMESEENRKLIADIKADSEWLINLVENLLTVTRMSNEDAKIEKQPELLAEVAADAVLKMKKRFPDHKIAMNVEPETLLVPMDPLLMTQVFVNLLENAVRHSGDRENITLYACTEGEQALIEVRDRGKGLPAEVLENLAEDKQAVGSGSGMQDSRKGSGLGLSVCYSIIHAHGGILEAANREEGGAAFRIRLPLEAAEQPAHDPAAKEA